MKYVKVKVIRDNNCVTVRVVPSWEVPVLEQVFGGPEAIQLVDSAASALQDAKDYPEAPVEFDRLVRRYGADRERGITYVAMAYGEGRIGIGRVDEQIAAARNADRKGVGRTAHRSSRTRRPAPAAGDILA